ncbi:MAG: hypothetical protein ACLQF2_18330 [Rhodomicrobium sp.]
MLILVAGPSGSGKDTLISAARLALADNPAFVFPSRLITRAGKTGEVHIYMPVRDFEQARRQKLFFLDWDAHGFSYGIPASVQAGLAAGRTAVVNVSRRLIPAARGLWRPTHAVIISAKPRRCASGCLYGAGRRKLKSKRGWAGPTAKFARSRGRFISSTTRGAFTMQSSNFSCFCCG